MTDEKTITELETALETIAQTTFDLQISLSETIFAIEESNEEIERRKAEMMSGIFSERFEINLKLKFTNDEQRKTRLIELQNDNLDFQNFVSARKSLAVMSAAQKAEIEKNQNLHKAKLLVLEYFANVP